MRINLLLYNEAKRSRVLGRQLFAAALFSSIILSQNIVLAKEKPAFMLNNKSRQIITVTGQVKDDQGQPLPGVSVLLDGTTTGTVTDPNGNYKLTVPDANAGGSISFSFIGFVKQTIAIKGQKVINVKLKIDATNTLNEVEVVSVGYGTQTRGSINGAVSSVGAKDIENKPVTNTFQALQGESPNLIIQQSSLDPGSNVTVNIRGVGTLGNNDPLVVIDGIVTNDPSSLNTLDPNDIASVTVLKDAGSAAIYGSRAANGVLLVTTKSGKLNQKSTVNYNGSYGLQVPNVLVHKVDAADNAYYKNEALVNSGLPPAYTPDQIQALKAQGNGT